MSPLHDSLADYLRIRRALGYKLERAEKLLAQYLEISRRPRRRAGHDRERHRLGVFACRPGVGTGGHSGCRSCAASQATCTRSTQRTRSRQPICFPTGFTGRFHTSTPRRRSRALIAATGSLRSPLRRATYRTLIGLLAVTGMRVGEAIRLDNDDVDLRHGVLTVRQSKFGKTRELPLHPRTVDALRAYLRVRDRPSARRRPPTRC